MKKTMLVALIASMGITGCMGRIETGHIGVRTDWNKNVELTPVPQGWYMAVFTSVDEYVTKEIEIKLDKLQPKGSDNLSLQDLDISVFYKVKPDAVPPMRVKYNSQSAQHDGQLLPMYILVEGISRSSIFEAVSHFESLTMHTKRQKLEQDSKALIQKELDAKDPGVFEVTRVLVRQLLTDRSLEASIQAAVQVQKQIEAKNNQIELARKEADRLKVEAQGQAVANGILAASLTPSYIQYKQVEAMQMFANKGGSNTVLIPYGQGANTMINIK